MQDRIREFLNSQFAEAVIREDNFRGDQSFFIRPEALVSIVQALQENTDLDVRYLCDITSVDWLGHEAAMGGRFKVVYNLYSLRHKYRFFLKVMLPAENPEIASLTPLYAYGADWMEREVWDMMGISFAGHPNLTKILTPDELEGHPLRRDYPLTWETPQFNWNKNEPPEVIR
jgi:NADH-quinone oxidoreductase subunit C